MKVENPVRDVDRKLSGLDPSAGHGRCWHALRAHRLLIVAVTAVALFAALPQEPTPSAHSF
jgi:hypothetical protein